MKQPPPTGCRWSTNASESICPADNVSSFSARWRAPARPAGTDSSFGVSFSRNCGLPKMPRIPARLPKIHKRSLTSQRHLSGTHIPGKQIPPDAHPQQPARDDRMPMPPTTASNRTIYSKFKPSRLRAQSLRCAAPRNCTTWHTAGSATDTSRPDVASLRTASNADVWADRSAVLRAVTRDAMAAVVDSTRELEAPREGRWASGS